MDKLPEVVAHDVVAPHHRVLAHVAAALELCGNEVAPIGRFPRLPALVRLGRGRLPRLPVMWATQPHAVGVGRPKPP
jgi:hypothetical protein